MNLNNNKIASVPTNLSRISNYTNNNANVTPMYNNTNMFPNAANFSNIIGFQMNNG